MLKTKNSTKHQQCAIIWLIFWFSPIGFFLSYFEIQIWQFFQNNCHIANCHISVFSKWLSYYILSYFKNLQKKLSYSDCHISNMTILNSLNLGQWKINGVQKLVYSGSLYINFQIITYDTTKKFLSILSQEKLPWEQFKEVHGASRCMNRSECSFYAATSYCSSHKLKTKLLKNSNCHIF